MMIVVGVWSGCLSSSKSRSKPLSRYSLVKLRVLAVGETHTQKTKKVEQARASRREVEDIYASVVD
jgi:hypothetical protein